MSDMPIIAAVDPRREDVAPAALGLLLARALDAPLVLAAAYPLDLAIDNLYPEYARALGRDASYALERVATALAATDVELSTTALEVSGSPARALHELAVAAGAQLLVIGSSDRGAAGRGFPGAVTDRLLHGAPCPVAVAPAGYSLADADRLRLIGAAFTDTPDGAAALEFASQLAGAAHALVRVLSVTEPPEPLIAGTVDAIALDAVREANEARTRSELQRAIDRLPTARSAGGEMLSGAAAGALAAASADLDLLVCGSRGYGPLRTLLLGGTSHTLVRRASCPVLVVPLGSTPLASGAADELEVAR
jgi:nucleotide-binding universal stress UspA family protein